MRVYDGRTGQPFAGVLGSFYGLAPGFTGGVFVAAGDVNGDGPADVIVGADQGGGPQVTVFSGQDASTLASFYALSPTFTGGVRVAAGDVDGDGKADILTGAGAGGLAQVTVFRGTDLAVLQSFFAFHNFTGGVFLAAGDVDGDGKADIITGAGPGGGPQVSIFSGADGSLVQSFYATNPNPTDVLAFDANARSGVRVGTTTAGGQLRILTAPGQGPPPLVNEFGGRTLALLDSFFAFAPTFRGGVFVGD